MTHAILLATALDAGIRLWHNRVVGMTPSKDRRRR